MKILLAILLLVQSVNLAWDANTETDLAGYKVYWGTASRVYGPPVVVPGTPATPRYTVGELAPGTYYFAVTAYNQAGLESGFSNEVSATIQSQTSKCDLNGDGSVDVLDLQLLINAILGTAPTDGKDINGDGQVNVLDLQLLSNIILGVAQCPPEED